MNAVALELVKLAGAFLFAGLAWSRLEVALGVILLVLPFLPTMVLAGLIGVTACVWLARRAVVGDWSFPRTRIWLPLAFFLGILGLAAATSLTRFSSVQQFGMWLVCVAGFVVALDTLRRREQFVLVVGCLLASAAVVAAIGMAQQVMGIETPTSWIDIAVAPEITTRVYSVFDNPTILAEYIVYVLPVAMLLFCRAPAGRKRVALGGIVALLLVCLVFTYSRGGWLSALAALLFVGVLYDRRVLPVMAVGVGLLPLVFPRGVLVRVRTVPAFEDASARYRLAIWTGCLRLLQDHWVAGIGLGLGPFLLLYQYYMIPGTVAYHAHNQVLQLAIETGVFGVIAFGWVMLTFYRDILAVGMLRSGYFAALTYGFAGGIAGQLLHATVDHIWYSPKLLLLFWLTLALALGARGQADAATEGASSPGRDTPCCGSCT